MSDHKKYDWDQNTLSSRKLMSWAFWIGERPIADGPAASRTHRGLLPDVDYNRIAAAPLRRPLRSRILDAVLGGLRRPAGADAAEAALRAALIEAVGERLAAAYIGEDGAGPDAIRAEDAASDQANWSRAA